MHQVTVAPVGQRATRLVRASLSATAAFLALCASLSFAHAAPPAAEAVKPSERHLSDRWITTKVRAELFAVSGNESIHVHIKTVRGAVTLTGQVTTQDMLQQFTRAAKALTSDPLRRLEHNVVRTMPRSRQAPGLDLGLHDGTPPGFAIREAICGPGTGSVRAPLVERFRTDVSRTTRVEALDGARVELALDVGEIGYPPLDAA